MLFALPFIRLESRRFTYMPPPLRRGSERGGFRGPVAPPPHDVADSAAEQAMLVYMTDPADAASTPESVHAELMKQVTE